MVAGGPGAWNQEPPGARYPPPAVLRWPRQTQCELVVSLPVR